MIILHTGVSELMDQNQKTCTDFMGSLNEVEMKHAPEFMFCAGDQGLLKTLPRISIIGSRSASVTGITLAREISKTVINHGGLVVSGLAKGIDTTAHRAAIDCGGQTIAVVGTPLSRVYPMENEALQNEIMTDHLVVSQFSNNHPVQPKNFILRNRTMALISHGSIIVEAEENSGTQHQGWEAIRLGRLLFLPKRLVEASFDWPQKMLEYGALVFENTEELAILLDEYLPSNREAEALRELRQ